MDKKGVITVRLQEKQKKTKSNKAITLIALVITIIILLILGGIAIATLTGENGLFARAKQAKETQTESEMKEKLNLSIQELQVEKLTEATLNDITQEWLTSKLSEYNPILKEDGTTNSKKVILQKNGIIKTYMIDENLNITEVENKSGIDFSYEIVKRENGKVKILIKVQDRENGINKVEVPGDAIILNGTREEKGIDQEIEVGTEYKFKVISTSGKEREETILIEPEIIVGDAYIGTSTTETNSTKSVPDNSQTRGTTLYINFTATLEKYGASACTVKLKDGTDLDTLPYVITKNGTYKFVVIGTYENNKTIKKEIEVKVKKYQVEGGFVQYDAGKWTQEEIENLKKLNMYNLNATHKVGAHLKFSGFTYDGDTENQIEISSGNIIIDRNQSVSPQSGYGIPAYNGWRILEELEEKNGRRYINKIIHAGTPENFDFYNKLNNDGLKAEYLLSNGTRFLEYEKEINKRSWDMYKDRNKLEFIKEVHCLTYDEINIITTKEIKNIGCSYFVATHNGNNKLFGISTSGETHRGLDYQCIGIRPVVSMVEGVYIKSGAGTEEEPYILGKD